VNSQPAPRLHAEAFRADPRVAEARALLAAALAEHSGRLTSPGPADPQATEAYQALLDRLTEARGGAPIWPYLAAGLGHGPYVELADGSVKLDFIGGIGVHGCGHSHPAMIEAAIDAALEDTVMQGNLQQHPPSIKLCERLVGWARESGAAIDHCLLSTSGAMANENAIKIALHHQAPADRFIAFDNAFSGRSLAMAAITDRPSYRDRLPVVLPVDYLPFFDASDPAGSTAAAVERLQKLLNRHPGRYAAFWAEVVAGEGGFYPGSKDFFESLARPLREAKVPIIFDEVQSFGRTTRPFAFQHFGLDTYADIVTVGKITQVCATLYGEAFKPQGPILSQTFTGASSSIATGLAMLDELESAGCFGSDGANSRRHDYFAAGLKRLSEQYPGLINGPFGIGMMIAFTPGDGSPEAAKTLMTTMYDQGLLGFVCGTRPTRVRFLPPPAITTNEHIDAALELLDRSLALFQNSSRDLPA